MSRSGLTTAVLLFVALVAAACGKKGAPLAPLYLVPSPVSDVSARRVEDAIRLRFVLPAKNINGPGINLDRVEIYAVTVEPGSETPPNRELLTKPYLAGQVQVKPPPVEGAPETPEDKRPAPGDAVTFAEQLSTLPPSPPRKVSKKPAPPAPAAAPGVATGVTPETEPTAPAPGETPPAAPAVPDPTAAEVPPEAAATPAGKTMPPPATPPPTQPGAPATAGAARSSRRGRGASSPCAAGPEDHPAHAHLRDSRCGSQRSKRSALRAHRGASRYHPGRAGRSQSGEHRESHSRRVAAGRRDGGGRLAHVQRLQGRCARGAAEREAARDSRRSSRLVLRSERKCVFACARSKRTGRCSSRARYPNRHA